MEKRRTTSSVSQLVEGLLDTNLLICGCTLHTSILVCIVAIVAVQYMLCVVVIVAVHYIHTQYMICIVDVDHSCHHVVHFK